MPAGAPRLLLLRRLLLLLSAALQLRCAPGEALAEAPFELRHLPRDPALSPQKKAPQFMLELFNAASGADGARGRQNDILEGNTVRSFQDQGANEQRIHFFNLSSLGREEKMVKAEFRWFRKKPNVRLGNSHIPHFYKVDLYEVQDSRVKPPRANLISSRLLPLYTQGWEVFNVTQTVSKWIQNSQESNGVLVVTSFPSGSGQPEVTDTSAFLVIFSDDGETEENHTHLGTQNHLSRRRRESPAFHPRAGPLSCRRAPLYVDFEKLGWSHWIIAPPGYNAYDCRGSCPFPLGLSATNHATIRSIMLKVTDKDVAAPCCVPDKLQSISLLVFDDQENVVLKKYREMVALSCGCH